MRLIVDMNEEHRENEACLWNNIVFALTTGADNDIPVFFEEITLQDMEYLLSIAGESIETGKLFLRNGSLIYQPGDGALAMDLGKGK